MNLEIFTNPRFFIVQMLIIFGSITLHEFGHAIAADRQGDDTPRRQGRLTLWPDKHLEPLGSLMIVITSILGRGIGWGRAVEFNPFGLKHPRRGLFIVAAFGPLMNLLLAVIAAIIWRVSLSTHNLDWLLTDRSYVSDYTSLMYGLDAAAYEGHLTTTGLFLWECLYLNLMLMFFNLIPLHPLDGSKITSSLLPLNAAIAYDRFVGQYGPMLLIALAVMVPKALWTVLNPIINAACTLLLGHPIV